MLYNNLDDMRILFEWCYQCVLLTTFVGKMLNEMWNQDKVNLLGTVLVPMRFSVVICVRLGLTGVILFLLVRRRYVT